MKGLYRSILKSVHLYIMQLVTCVVGTNLDQLHKTNTYYNWIQREISLKIYPYN